MIPKKVNKKTKIFQRGCKEPLSALSQGDRVLSLPTCGLLLGQVIFIFIRSRSCEIEILLAAYFSTSDCRYAFVLVICWPF
jgi:hypothetical protein